MYIVGLVAGFAVALPWIDLTLSAPWQSLPNWAHYAANIQDSYRAEMSNFWPHALLHLVMLHGLVPNEILNHASEAFLPAAWSLSLEWQFYLIAPLVLAALFRRWSACLVIVVAAIGYILYSRHTLGTYSTPSTIFASSPYFAIGIASRLLVDRLSGFRIAPVLPPLLIAVVAILLRAGLGVTIWVTFYSYMLWKDRGGVDGRIFKTIFQNRASLLLGEASYSVYLLHRPIQVMTAYLIRPHSQIGMVVLMVCSLLPTFGISLLTFKMIERPSEMLGRRIASRFGKAATPEPLPA